MFELLASIPGFELAVYVHLLVCVILLLIAGFAAYKNLTNAVVWCLILIFSITFWMSFAALCFGDARLYWYIAIEVFLILIALKNIYGAN